MFAIFLSSIATAIITAVVLVFLIPLLKVEVQRRKSRAHIPTPQEIWLQLDTNTLFYIDMVGPNGVTIVSINEKDQRDVQTWHDFWDEWRLRMKAHTVLFTGQRQALTPT